MAKDKGDNSGSVVIPKTKPDCTEVCPECNEEVCNHSLDNAKLHLNTILRKKREGKLVH